jgi:hypothetical protein
MRSFTGGCRRGARFPRAKSTHFEPEAVCKLNEAAGLNVLPELLVVRPDFLEVGGGDVEIESEVCRGVHSRAKRAFAAVEGATKVGS